VCVPVAVYPRNLQYRSNHTDSAPHSSCENRLLVGVVRGRERGSCYSPGGSVFMTQYTVPNEPDLEGW
jgi:hypothetical protein